jgi:hypothetical protein
MTFFTSIPACRCRTSQLLPVVTKPREKLHSVLRSSLLAAACTCFILLSSSVWGQASGAASVLGTVTDSTGNSVPGVRVTLTSPALQVQKLTATTGAEGDYKFNDLPAPGVYNVKFEREGFQTFVHSDFNLSVGFAARIDATLVVGSVTQTVEVTTAGPVVDTVNTSTDMVVNSEELENIPKGALIQETMPMVAGLNLAGKPDVGDSNLASRAQIITYGVPLQPTLDVEGLDTDMDHSGNSSDYLDAYSIQELEFKTAGNTADIPFAGVAQIAVMKSGSNSYHGSLQGNYENPSFQSNNITAALAGPPSNLTFTNPITGSGYYDFAGDLGGRIIRDRLWAYGGYSKQSVHQEQVGYVGKPGPTCAPVIAWVLAQCPSATPAQIFAYLPEFNLKTSYQITRSINVNGSYQHSNKEIPNQGGSTLEPLSTSLYENEPTQVWKGEAVVAHTHWVLDAVYGFAGTQPSYIPQPANNGFTSAGLAGDPPEEDLYNKLFTGTNDEVYLHIYDRHESTETFSFFPGGHHFGTHQFKFGTTWDWEEGDTQVPAEFPSGDYLLIFNSPNAQATTPTPYEITVYNYPVFPKNLLHAQAAFATDTWQLKKRISLNLGVRWERYNSLYPNQQTTAKQFSDIFTAQTVPGASVLAWKDIVPRIGGAWDVRGNGKTVVKGFFGIFGDTMGFLYANLYNPESVQSKTYHWNVGAAGCNPTAASAAVEWACDVQPSYLATLPSLTPISATGGPSQLDNTSLQQDKTFEYHIEVERELASNLSLRVGFIEHRIYNLFDSQTNGGSIAATTTYVGNGIAVGHPYSSYTLPATFSYTLNGVANPVTLYTYPAGSGTTSNEYLNTPSNRPDVYNTLEIAVTKHSNKRWDALTSFWMTKDHRWIEGLAGIAGSPNDDPYNIDTTWNWEARASLTYKLPLNFNASTLFRATSGAYGQLTDTFSGTGTNGQALNQGSVTVRLSPFGQYQGPVVSNWNVKVTRLFRFRDNVRIEPAFQVFNILNGSAAVATSYAVPTFGAVTSIVSPRVFRLGGSVSF